VGSVVPDGIREAQDKISRMLSMSYDAEGVWSVSDSVQGVCESV